MALLKRDDAPKQTKKERTLLRNHLEDLGDLREERLTELGTLAFEMNERGNLDQRQLWEKASEIAKIDEEAELVHRGLTEGLTMEQLAEIERSKGQ